MNAPSTKSKPQRFFSSCCHSEQMTIRGGDDELGDHSWVECDECGQPCHACDPCICGVSEPDEFGNRDLLENPDCPYHGEENE